MSKKVTFAVDYDSLLPMQCTMTNKPQKQNIQKPQVKTVILRRNNLHEDWGLEISGKGWADGEWMRK